MPLVYYFLQLAKIIPQGKPHTKYRENTDVFDVVLIIIL